MPLADLSIDDVIALACREVPECDPGPTLATVNSGDTICIGVIGTTCSSHMALWFCHAWEWLMNHNLALFEEGACEWLIEKQPGNGWMTFLDPRFPDPPVNFDGKWTAMPTKYHALASAVLLAAGKVVP